MIFQLKIVVFETLLLKIQNKKTPLFCSYYKNKIIQRKCNLISLFPKDTIEHNDGLLNLSKTCMKKIPKVDDAQSVRVLILDDNELQKIDNIDSFLKIEKVIGNIHISIYNF